MGTTSLITLFKNSSYIVAFIAGVEYLGFHPESIVILATLMGLDLFTAIVRVFQNEGGKKITSAAFKRGLTAKMLLGAALFGIAITTRGVGMDFQVVAQGMINTLMVGELYSILGNVHSAHTGKPKVEFDVLNLVLARVKKMLEKVTTV